MNEEQALQINLIAWFTYTYPEFKDDIHHFANERKCTPQYGMLLKRMGVKKGVSDIFLAIPRNDKAGLWLELKVGKNRPTMDQMAFLERKELQGYASGWCASLDEAKTIISDYLGY